MLSGTPSTMPCARCQQNPPHLRRTIAAFRYAYPLDGLIQRLKYQQQLALADWLGTALADKLAETRADTRPNTRAAPNVSALIPMPLHPRRLRERGFNQAVEIARPVARTLHIPLLLDAVQRYRDTPAQVGLSYAERQANLRGAFVLNPKFRSLLRGRRVALLDDVLTTSASLNALAETVLEAGVTEVEAWVVARTVEVD